MGHVVPSRKKKSLISDKAIVAGALEEHLEEGRLRDNAGFLMGWITAHVLPHPASSERRVLWSREYADHARLPNGTQLE
jgi:hypothetical protein